MDKVTNQPPQPARHIFFHEANKKKIFSTPPPQSPSQPSTAQSSLPFSNPLLHREKNSLPNSNPYSKVRRTSNPTATSHAHVVDPYLYPPPSLTPARSKCIHPNVLPLPIYLSMVLYFVFYFGTILYVLCSTYTK